MTLDIGSPDLKDQLLALAFALVTVVLIDWKIWIAIWIFGFNPIGK